MPRRRRGAQQQRPCALVASTLGEGREPLNETVILLKFWFFYACRLMKPARCPVCVCTTLQVVALSALLAGRVEWHNVGRSLVLGVGTGIVGVHWDYPPISNWHPSGGIDSPRIPLAAATAQQQLLLVCRGHSRPSHNAVGVLKCRNDDAVTRTWT